MLAAYFASLGICIGLASLYLLVPCLLSKTERHECEKCRARKQYKKDLDATLAEIAENSNREWVVIYPSIEPNKIKPY